MRWKLAGDSEIKPSGWNVCLRCKRKRCHFFLIRKREQKQNSFILQTFPSTKICSQNTACSVIQTCCVSTLLWWLNPARHSRGVDFEREIPRLDRRHHRSEASEVDLEIDDGKDTRTDLVQIRAI